MTKETFVSLTNAQEAYDTQRGREFRAHVQGFFAKDAEIRQANSRFAVSSFMNLYGSTQLINEELGLTLAEEVFKKDNGEEILSTPANITIFTETLAEAEAYAQEMTKSAQFSSPVRVSSHTYEDKTFIDLVVDDIFVQTPRGRMVAPKRRKK